MKYEVPFYANLTISSVWFAAGEGVVDMFFGFAFIAIAVGIFILDRWTEE